MFAEMVNHATRNLRGARDGSFPRVGCLLASSHIKKALENVKRDANQRVVYPAFSPISGSGGVVSRNGASAPKGAIVKVASMIKFLLKAPARRDRRDGCAIAAFEGGTSKDREAPQAPSNPYPTHLFEYASQAGPAVNGAVPPGGKA